VILIHSLPVTTDSGIGSLSDLDADRFIELVREIHVCVVKDKTRSNRDMVQKTFEVVSKEMCFEGSY
jgi:hypothetical protein